MPNTTVKRREEGAAPSRPAAVVAMPPEAIEMGRGRDVWEWRAEGLVNCATGEIRDELFIRISDGRPVRNLRGSDGERLCWSEDAVYRAIGGEFLCASCPHVSERAAFAGHFRGKMAGDLDAILKSYKGDCRFEYELGWDEQFCESGGQIGPDPTANSGMLTLSKASAYALLDPRDPASYQRAITAHNPKADFCDFLTRVFISGTRLGFEAVSGLPKREAPSAAVSVAPKGAPAAVSAALGPQDVKVQESAGVPEDAVLVVGASGTAAVVRGVEAPGGLRSDLVARLEALGGGVKGIVLGVLGVKEASEVKDADLEKFRCVVEEAEKQTAKGGK